MTVGERIKTLREKCGISQVSLADKIEVSKQSLYKYENNIITNIPSDKIEKIAEITNVSPAYIMGWEHQVKASASSTLYNVHCETKDEADLVLSFRELSDVGKKKVSSYTTNILNIELADLELNAAHERTDAEVTSEMKKHDDDIMDDDNF